MDGPATAKLRGPYRSVLVAGLMLCIMVCWQGLHVLPTTSVISDRLAHGRQLAGCQVMQTVKHRNTTKLLDTVGPHGLARVDANYHVVNRGSWCDVVSANSESNLWRGSWCYRPWSWRS